VVEFEGICGLSRAYNKNQENKIDDKHGYYSGNAYCLPHIFAKRREKHSDCKVLFMSVFSRDMGVVLLS